MCSSGEGEGTLEVGTDSGTTGRLVLLGGDGPGKRVSNLPSIEPFSRIFLVSDLVSTP
jgi:hypothetical protein